MPKQHLLMRKLPQYKSQHIPTLMDS